MSTDMLSHLTESIDSEVDESIRVCCTCHYYSRIDDKRGKCKKYAPVVLDGYIDVHQFTAIGFWPGVFAEEPACGEYYQEWEL